MKSKGKLIRWNEDRGFGFIKTTNIKDDVFIHISELKKMSRAPQLNDIIYFDIATDSSGKKKAINASIEGVTEKSITIHRKKSKPKKLYSLAINFALSISIGLVAYLTYPWWSSAFTNSLPVNLVSDDFTGFSCEGKQYCSQMTSCKEARFYLKNCPNVKIDGNNDGVPCESQLCN